MKNSNSLLNSSPVRIRYLASAALFAVSIWLPSAVLAESEPEMTLPSVTVGKNLEAMAAIRLPQSAPKGGVKITITSDDPKRLLFSRSQEIAGSPSIVVNVPGSIPESADFYIQALDDSGTATYTASAPGYASGTGKITLAPSGFILAAPSLASKTGPNSFEASRDAGFINIRIVSALLDPSGNYVSKQMLAGGVSASVEVTNSNPEVGSLVTSKATFLGGFDTATLKFKTSMIGTTTLALSTPPGFTAPATEAKLIATFTPPGVGFGLTNTTTVGKDLQLCDSVTLGRPAPAEGLPVTLTSNNPDFLLIPPGSQIGTRSITVTIPAGGFNVRYCMQALSDSGTALVEVSAPEHRGRTVTVHLAPSGVLLGYKGPPDEAELFTKESGERVHGIGIRQAGGPVTFELYIAKLDITTHRGADITVGYLRSGVTPKVELKSSDPTVGTIASPITLSGSHAGAVFTPLAPGKTVVSISTPPGFTTPGNAQSFIVVVQ